MTYSVFHRDCCSHLAFAAMRCGFDSDAIDQAPVAYLVFWWCFRCEGVYFSLILLFLYLSFLFFSTCFLLA